MKHLQRIHLYITNECDQNCRVCAKAYKQIPWCTRSKYGGSELDTAKIEALLHEITNSSLIYLDILGGNIFDYSRFAALVEIINHLPARKNYYSHYQNIIPGSDKLKFVNPASSLLKILIPAPINEENLKAALQILEKSKLPSEFIFLIQDGREFEKAGRVAASLQIDNYDYQPLFNGENLQFFKENVFITKEEILGSKPAMNDIYAHSEINTLNFGKLIVSPAGRVYADLNAPGLGMLGKDSIYDVLYREAYHGKSWRRVRKNVQPCKCCTYQALCPPLSDYTYALGRNDLCHINKEQG
jgi:pseudo-rSAM protein